MRVTVLFDNLGPYHLARLTAAATRCELACIELHASSRDYLWRREDSKPAFKRYTVFEATDDTARNASELAAKLIDAIKATKPEVVAIPGWSGWHAFAALDWCSANEVPVVVMSESTAHDEPRTPWKEWIKRQYVGLCAAALVGGERHAEYLAQLHMPLSKIFYGYNAVENQYFSSAVKPIRASADEWRQRLALPHPYFLASARFIPKKNLAALLGAYADYRTKIKSVGDSSLAPWDLVILGDGELRGDLEAARERHGLTNCVHLPGFKQYDELPPYFALAEAFVHPSTVEPWGLVVNEAMASGLPVLVSNRCGCAPTLAREGENGHTFDPFDTEAITNSLVTMSRLAPEQRAAMGRRSQQIIADFGPNKFAEGLVAAADSALSSQPKQRRLVDRLVLKSLLRRSIPHRRQIA